MKREEVELQSDRAILVDLLVGQAVLEERTAGWEEKIESMALKAERNESDIAWIKRLGVASIALVGGALGVLRWIGM